MNRKRWCLAVAVVLAVNPALRADPPQAQPAQTEVRDFVVQVGNKTAGQYHLTVTRQADGSEHVAISANVEVKFTWRFP